MGCWNTKTQNPRYKVKQKQSKIIQGKRHLKFGLGFGPGKKRIEGSFQIGYDQKANTKYLKEKEIPEQSSENIFGKLPKIFLKIEENLEQISRAIIFDSTSSVKNLRHALAAALTSLLIFLRLIKLRSLYIVHLSAAEETLYRFSKATCYFKIEYHIRKVNSYSIWYTLHLV